ncbi:MAG: hypothetical protein R6U44_05480 [Archaeoglobaceae archaeon]
MRNTAQVYLKPCDRDYSGSYSFPCVSGLCPYNADFERDCYPRLDYEMQELFEELISLRINSKRRAQLLVPALIR